MLRGDVQAGIAGYLNHAVAGHADHFVVYLALVGESGASIPSAIEALPAAAKLVFARWCFGEGRFDLGVIAFKGALADSSLQVEEADFVEYLRQVEAAVGLPGVVAAADELLPLSHEPVLLRTCVQALNALGDHEGAQQRLQRFGDASATMGAGNLKAADVMAQIELSLGRVSAKRATAEQVWVAPEGPWPWPVAVRSARWSVGPEWPQPEAAEPLPQPPIAARGNEQALGVRPGAPSPRRPAPPRLAPAPPAIVGTTRGIVPLVSARASAPLIRQPAPPLPSPALEDDTTANSDRRAGAKAGHPLIGKVLADRFTLTAFLSEGRIAQVFSAAQPTGQPRQVAVKVLLPGFAQDLEVTRRFLRAAEKARRLQHPEIATMFAAGEEHGLLYVIGELILGENLSSYIDARGPLSQLEAARVVLQIGTALEVALTSGVIHRGLRPSNVFITRYADQPDVERIKVADFGMADVVDALRPLDGYVAPERLRGELGDPRADVYSLGAVLYQLLCGKTPFGELPPDRLVHAIRNNPLPAPSMNLHPGLAALLERAVRKDPSERYQNARDFDAELRLLLAELEREEEPPTRQNQPYELYNVEESTDKTETKLPSMLWAQSGAPHPRANHPLIGRVLANRFRVTGLMRGGGMAQLFYATELNPARRVAIKVMHPMLASEPELVRRFDREIRLAAKLSHPNIVELIHVGDDPELLFIAMELLSGEDLSIRIKQRGRSPEAQAAEVAIDICKALAYAHELGVVHRDIKPANVMMCSGFDRDVVKLLDFGIAKLLEGSSAHTVAGGPRSAITIAGDLVGTPRYMAPEQGRADKVDHRTDLYALGVVLYELVTGVVPFNGETPLQIVARHVHDPPKPPSQLIRDLNPELERIILALLEKQPENRPQSAGEVRAQLEAILPQLAVTTAASTTRWLAKESSSGPMAPVLPAAIGALAGTPPRSLVIALPVPLPDDDPPTREATPQLVAGAQPLATKPTPRTLASDAMPAEVAAVLAKPATQAQGSSTVKMDREQVLQQAAQFLPQPRPAEAVRSSDAKATLPMQVSAQAQRAAEAAAPAIPTEEPAARGRVVASTLAQTNVNVPAADPAKPALEAQIAKLYRVVLFLIVLVVIALLAIVVMALTRNG